jgi:hypothetical protein
MSAYSSLNDGTATGTATAEQRRANGRRRQDALDEPARPLGPKAALLHARRVNRKAAQRDLAEGTEHGSVSEDGAVSFKVEATPAGLGIERVQRRPLGTQFVQVFLFDDTASFKRWCDTDPIRFQYPLLHGQVRRQGDDYFAAKG